MNWEAAIARNRQALLEIILALMASVGLQKNGMLTTLPFHLYRKALTIIRVAETAVRRLIFIAAHDMKLRGFNPKTGRLNPNGGALFSPLEGEMSAKPTERGAPDYPSNQQDRLPSRVRILTDLNTAVAPLSALSGISPSRGEIGAPSFEPLSKRPIMNPNGGALISPPGVPASGLPLKGGAENKARGQGEGAFAQPRMFKFQDPSSAANTQFEPFFRRYPRATHLRISFPLIEPLKTFTEDPRDFASLPHEESESSREPTPATALGNRLLALHFALTNIERQARRLLRWEARRDAALKQNRPYRMTPMRPGLPPFYSRKPVTEIEKILKECHGLTHYARDNEAFITRKGVP